MQERRTYYCSKKSSQLYINGRPVKSINQFYNKKKDKLKVVIESKDYRQKEI